MSPTLIVLRALGLGDFLTAVPALRAVAEAFPNHRRVLAMPRALAPLAALLRGPDGRPAYHLVHAAGLAPLPGQLRDPDVAVNLHGRGPESHGLLRALRPRRLVAFGEPGRATDPQWRPREHEVRRWCRMLAGHRIPADPSRLRLPAPRVAAPSPAGGATVLHPGAASPARRWPDARWAALARHERERGRAVVITGDASERRLAAQVAAAARLPGEAVLAGRTDVAGLAAVVAAAGRVVCGDTGVSHLATALGTPSLSLFGPTPPGEWGPPAGRRHRVLWAGQEGDPHGAGPFPGLLAITVDETIDALDALDPPADRAA